MRSASSYSYLFDDPAWLLAGLNSDQETFLFVRTDERIIRQSAFLDGRTPIGVDERVLEAPFEAVMAWSPDNSQTVAQPDRLLVHVSFCGSTLLGRLLQGDRGPLGYSEPQVLVELATLKAQKHPLTQSASKWRALLKFALAQYRKTWGEAPTFVKPSNWVNTLLGDMLEVSDDARYAIIQTNLEDYLIANLRGGKSRLTYSLNLLNHFLSANSTYRAQVLEIERANLEPIQRLLRLLMVVYETQLGLFEMVQAGTKRASICRVTKADLQTQTEKTVLKVASALDLPLSVDDVDAAVARKMKHHAKDSQLLFQPDVEAAENTRLKQELGSAFEAAFDWRKTAIRSVA